jgi:hypothetical protein
MKVFGSLFSSALTPASNGSSSNGFSDEPSPDAGSGISVPISGVWSTGPGAGAGGAAGAGLFNLSLYFTSVSFSWTFFLHH